MIPILYKYHKFDCEGYLFQLLESHSFYMAPRTTMNDIYDCYFRLSKKYIRNHLTKGKSNWFTKLLLNNDKAQFLLHMDFLSRGFNPGILCFTEHSDNDILWAYYTNSFKGVCLGFDFNNEDANFLKQLKKIRYTNNFTIDNEEDLSILPFRKKKVYKHENEWRIAHNESKHKQPFNISSLKNIYFGIKSKQKDILQTMDICESCGYKLTYHKMVLNFNHNNISFKTTNREDIQKTWSDILN